MKQEAPMRKFWKIAGIVALVVALGAMATVAVTYAQDSEDGLDWPFDFRARFREAIAGVLGISAEEYDAAVDQAQDQVLDQAAEEGWFTEDQADKVRERKAEGFPPGRRGLPRGRGGFVEDHGKALLNIAAEELGMSAKDLWAELKDGKSVADVAAEQGVDTQVIVDAYLTKMSERLDQAVEDGKLTQERADWMLEQAGAKFQELMEKTWDDCDCRPGGFRGGKRPGRLGSFPGQSDA
jgi:hypothetical protein